MEKQIDKIGPEDHNHLINIYYCLELKTLIDRLVYQHWIDRV